MNRLINLFLSVFIIALFFLLSPLEFQTSVKTLLPTKQSAQTFEKAQMFQSANSLVIYAKNIQDLKNASRIVTMQKGVQKEILPWQNEAYSDYVRRYKHYLGTNSEIKTDTVEKQVRMLYEQILFSPFFTIDSTDPLGVFAPNHGEFLMQTQEGFIEKNGYYFGFFRLQDAMTKPLYKVLQTLPQNVKVFSPQFYYYENPQKITAQINAMMAVGTLVLLFLFLYLIKDVFLFINTYATLLASGFFALLALSVFIQSVSIFVVVFGVIICAVGIDYMFHNYYSGNFQSKKLNKEVFFGFFTTAAVLLILSFNNYELIRDIALFAFFSLSYSYVVFNFIYPRFLSIKAPKSTYIGLKPYFCVAYKKFAFIVSAIVVVLFYISEFNTTIAQLDYDNKPLKTLDKQIAQLFEKTDQSAFLLETSSVETLLNKAQTLRQNGVQTGLEYLLSHKQYLQKEQIFQSQSLQNLHEALQKSAQQTGFKKEYFAKSYTYASLHRPFVALDVQTLQKFGFDVIEKEGKIYYLFDAPKSKSDTLAKQGVQAVNFDLLFAQGFETIYRSLLLQALLAGAFIVIFLYFSSKNYFRSLSFILFPLAFIGAYGSVFGMNIMSVIATFAVVAIAVDYGIYTANTPEISTKKAIIYSLITTFAGFGVLSFSSVEAIYSLGIVAVLAIIAILLLLASEEKGRA